jgi:hypothetical protein
LSQVGKGYSAWENGKRGKKNVLVANERSGTAAAGKNWRGRYIAAR